MAEQRVTLHNGVVTATGNGATHEIPRGVDEMTTQVAATGVTGTTPSFTVIVEGSFDGTNWYDLTTHTALTAAGDDQKHVSESQGATVVSIPPLIRSRWTVSGTTPSATLDITAFFEVDE